ncbi:hypothetical protein CM19_03535 [Candidatus Acidianus copahuensis]|uniref:Transposase n=1 Tax=Candidatus Acidianus copahuensis TaxID=1160895 RepID=A0A031LT95_9CREN|nr:hypothetical protein [Candidatus Acidianus copahuensis]EZQ10714.1 hypothetical protein CM19_03535 [Candidatus Acidianus copahuensis]
MKKAKERVSRREKVEKQFLNIYVNKMLTLENAIFNGDWNSGETLMVSPFANRTLFNDKPVGELKKNP